MINKAIFAILLMFSGSDSAMNWGLSQAQIPEPLWPEFKRMVQCESGTEWNAIGDGGLAVGLLQIHHDDWLSWLNEQEPITDLSDPVQNLRAGHLINSSYDVPQYGRAWVQWTRKPNPDAPFCDPGESRYAT